jgi:cell division protein FtsL
MAVVPAPRRFLADAQPAPRPAQPVERTRPDLRVVDDPITRRFSITVITAFGVGAMFVVLFGVVVFHTMLLQNQSRLDHLQADVRTEQARYQTLRLQTAELQSPQRIVDVATHQLGMVPPAGTTYLTPPASATTPVAPAESTTATGAAAPAPGDANDLPSSNDGASEWPQVKPYLGATP